MNIKKAFTVVCINGWWGLLLSILPIISLFNHGWFSSFLESDFFILLILADIKNSERWLNVGIYGSLAMLSLFLASFIYRLDYYNIYGCIALFVVMSLLVIWRSTILIKRKMTNNTDLFIIKW